jgi:uncharacterized protein (TIGR02271 family)
MTTLQQEDLRTLRGGTLFDQDGKKMGTVDDIYLDRDTDRPEWALVNTGLFGTKSSFVPIAQATREGNGLRVPYTKDHVAGAPRMDPDGELSQQEEAQLYAYYGLDYSEGRSDSGLPAGERDVRDASRDYDAFSDDAMTRSEEELRIEKTQREAGKARLRKYVVTENVQQTVPVEREEVRLEREPVTDANVDKATSGPDISEAQHEVVLAEEEPVVEKGTVPKERVRVTKDKVTDEREVSEELRKEQIEAEGDVRRR